METTAKKLPVYNPKDYTPTDQKIIERLQCIVNCFLPFVAYEFEDGRFTLTENPEDVALKVAEESRLNFTGIENFKDAIFFNIEEVKIKFSVTQCREILELFLKESKINFLAPKRGTTSYNIPASFYDPSKPHNKKFDPRDTLKWHNSFDELLNDIDYTNALENYEMAKAELQFVKDETIEYRREIRIKESEKRVELFRAIYENWLPIIEAGKTFDWIEQAKINADNLITEQAEKNECIIALLEKSDEGSKYMTARGIWDLFTKYGQQLSKNIDALKLLYTVDQWPEATDYEKHLLYLKMQHKDKTRKFKEDYFTTKGKPRSIPWRSKKHDQRERDKNSIAHLEESIEYIIKQKDKIVLLLGR